MEGAAEEETGRPEPEAAGEAPATPELPVEEPQPQPLQEAPAIDNAEQGPPAPADAEAEPAAADVASDQPNTEDPGDAVEAAAETKPTPEQYDALRQAIRERLA